MMKKTFILLVAILLILTISPNKAFATYLDPYLDSPYMTDEGSIVEKDVFDWDEEPFAYIGFNVTDLNTRGPLELTWSWYFDTDLFIASESLRLTSFLDDPLNIWNSMDSWDTEKRLGEWKTVINWENRVLGGKGGWGSQTVNFTVTPEPASSILFLIGAAALAARHYRKKRKTA